LAPSSSFSLRCVRYGIRGFSGAASALVGQALGMGDPQRAFRSGWAAVRMAFFWATAAGVVFMVIPQFLLGIFTNDQRVIDAGVGALAIVGIGQPAQAVIFTLGGGHLDEINPATRPINSIGHRYVPQSYKTRCRKASSHIRT